MGFGWSPPLALPPALLRWRLPLAPGFSRRREPLLSSGVTSPGFGHVFNQAEWACRNHAAVQRGMQKYLVQGERDGQKQGGRRGGCSSVSVEAFCKRKREGVSRPPPPRTVSIIFLLQIIKPKIPVLLMFLLKHKHFEHCFQTLFHRDFGTSIPHPAKFARDLVWEQLV